MAYSFLKDDSSYASDDNVEVTTYTASDGYKVRAVLFDGVCLQEFPGMASVLKEFKRLETRPDDVWIVAYPRCGTHWIWEVVSMIAQGKAERIQESKQFNSVELQAGLQWPIKTLPSPRILNCHLLPKHFPASALNESRFILILRNPKDVVVSNYFLRNGFLKLPYEGKISGFVDLFLEDKVFSGGMFQYINRWCEVYQKDKARFIILSYEKCTKDLTSAVQKIAEFLGKERDHIFYEQVASLCSFGQMKADKGNVHASYFKENSAGLFREGKAGRWRSHISDAQGAAIDAKMEREIQDNDFKELLR